MQYLSQHRFFPHNNHNWPALLELLFLPWWNRAAIFNGILQDIPHNKNNDCYKTPDEIPYECPKGVVPPVLSIKLREANARGCHKR
ncbi:hypothetical protein PSTG_13685 [Puccinia striiformis f. sp. tritici PST-78]|uniref:Uncharacterized protein n=1 Tax=Puccinia striiformis f. sp. tritici PST-78 TaxID=1165861 RepID=A0A0L0V136_9BASI|nr:hypothetical protein PSTG_13685 [Puccinia striiformis f. sp. tritici PST-78]